MDIDQANITNLTGLWRKYGAGLVSQNAGSQLLATRSWPYRCWLEGEQDRPWQIKTTPPTHKLSIRPHPLEDSDTVTNQQHLAPHWQLEFEQTAMYLPFNTTRVWQTPEDSPLTLTKVEDEATLREWTAISSDAFGYQVDINVLLPLLSDADIDIFLGRVDQQAAVTALLYRSGQVTGLHQMGVSRRFQGQGLARQMMLQLLTRTQQQDAKYMVLQASAAGLPVYHKLGFRSQFRLRHFTYVRGAANHV